MKPSSIKSLTVTNSTNGTTMQISQMETFDSYKYVGIHIAIDGNQRNQFLDLSEKCIKMSTVFSQFYFNAKDSEQGFITIYAPLIKYALPATCLSCKQLCAIQQLIITSALSQLGFNPHMPRAVIHASMWYGGAGIMDLH